MNKQINENFTCMCDDRATDKADRAEPYFSLVLKLVKFFFVCVMGGW